MAILLLLDTSGVVAHLRGATTTVDVAGLVALERRLAGSTLDLDQLAAEHHGDREALASLLAAVDELEPIAPYEPVPVEVPVASTPRPAAAGAPDLLLQARLPQPVIGSASGWWTWPLGHPDPVRLDALEVAALACFAMPTRPRDLPSAAIAANPLLSDAESRDAVVGRLCELGLLGVDLSVPFRASWDRGKATSLRVHHRTRALVEQQEQLLATRPPRGGRVPVYGVERAANTRPPLALGLLFAAAMAHDGGRLEERYDFVLDWHVRPASVRRAVGDGPGVWLFSNYVWSASGNQAISAKVKELSPASVVVHGGPHTPRFPGDRERYLEANPWVDVLVHGEGEATLVELLDRLDGCLDGNLHALCDVPGITVRPEPGAAPVTTADRPRIEDLDALPSPYLAGVFDAWRKASIMVTIETNRGCPYGCTFCDWGSATNSRIRKFDLDRVFDEIRWAVDAEIPLVMIADANFGIFERDVEIARFLAECKERTGFPDRLITNYAKNTVKHLEPIVSILSDARLDVNGVMSVQSFDPDVLSITKRKNLRAEEFERLASRFRANQMPMLTDLMVGLPGSTLETTRSDLQGVIEFEVNANVHSTQLLPNSPMNEPAYREAWDIVAGDDGLLISTSSYTAAERREMDRLVLALHAADTYGGLRQVLRWLAGRLGEREIDVLDRMRVLGEERPGTYPLVHQFLSSFLDTTTPPGSWSALLDEVGGLIAARWSIPVDDPEWRTIRTLQLHVLPERARAFPDVVHLDHDAIAWLRDHRLARGLGQPSPRLSSYPPVTFEVDDPYDTCAGMGTRHVPTDHHSFELRWPGARHVAYRWSPD